jgi:predicted KAP-like P-loop ATPase
MPGPNYFNDSPITSPDEDRFGIDPFARALATSFAELASPVGSTIAINGPWGSGKSSAVNLIRHHLKKNENLVIVDFSCWWFRGEEALTLAFLQTLYATLERGLGEKAKELIPKIGKKLLQAGSVVGPAVDVVSGGVPLGTLVAGGFDFAKRFFSDSDSIESLFERLSEALAREHKRYLVIIDDIDRLTPDEALLIFRLVKSVGRLPNVMYLLVFDRELAEKAVKERYPSEGPHFLEKIIQANFEVPLPGRDELNNAMLAEIGKLCEVPTDAEAIGRVMNIFYDGVAPYLNTPRDVARLTNAIAVTWPAVKNEVNLGDFIGLEAMRVFEPVLYSAIRSSKGSICGVRADFSRRDDTDEIVEQLVTRIPEKRREHTRDALKRLFPRLQNVGYGASFIDSWKKQRLICTKEHFDTYFRLAIGDETLSIGEITDIIEHAGDSGHVKDIFKQALNSVRKSGKSKVPLLFDELNAHASEIDKARFQTLVSALFEIADDIDREEDRERAFSIGDNHLRIH